jgi:hypothetical protein
MSELDFDACRAISRVISDRDKCDIFIYNGEIERSADLHFIETVYKHKRHEKVRLLLTTQGGDPDAAYKIARYLLEKYEKVETLISGLCKSAGTLIVIGSHEVIFTPYGELGPLDVQIAKEDKIAGMHSGLNISEALRSLERTAVQTYLRVIGDIIKSSKGVVSFPTASKAASDVLGALYAPIFSRFDPEDVGSRARSMRIASDYGKRLNAVAESMRPNAIKRLAETYPSHGFVIDRAEAQALFRSVRGADALEIELVQSLGECSRWPLSDSTDEALIDCLSAPPKKDVNNADQDPEGESADSSEDGGDPSGARSGDGSESDRPSAGNPVDS